MTFAPVQCAPPDVCILPDLSRPASGPCLCIQRPQREWLIRCFHVPEHVGFITVPPLLPDPTPRGSTVANRISGRTPCCCVIHIPCFFFVVVFVFLNIKAGRNRTATEQTGESNPSPFRTYWTARQLHSAADLESFNLIGHVRTKRGPELY